MNRPRNPTEEDLKQFQENMAQRVRGSDVGSHARVGINAGTEKPHQASSPACSEKQNRRARAGSNPAPSPPKCTQTFFVPGVLPGANDIIRKHRMVYSRLKSQWGLTIARCILVSKMKRVRTCRIVFLWQEPNNKRDDDNVIFAQKFVLDALRDTKIIPDDRRKFIESLTHRVIVEPARPGVQVTVEELLELA